MNTVAKPISYGPSSAADPNEGRRFGGAFWVSATLHGLLLGLLIGLTITLRDKLEDAPQVFELVAGVGNDYNATEAAGGGTLAETVSAELFQAPTVPVAKLPPTADPVEESYVPPVPVVPVPPAPVEPAPPVKSTAPVVPKTPNLARDFQRTVDRAKKKAEAASQKRIEAAERAAKAAALESKRMSLEDFRRQNSAKSGSSTSTATANPGKRINLNSLSTKGPGGPGTSQAAGAGGPAMQRAIQDAQDSYFAMLIQQLKSNHVKPEGLSDLLSADVSFHIASNGMISRVTITRSSGNSEFDQSVLAAFSRTGSIGPRPDKKSDSSTLTFRMKDMG